MRTQMFLQIGAILMLLGCERVRTFVHDKTAPEQVAPDVPPREEPTTTPPVAAAPVVVTPDIVVATPPTAPVVPTLAIKALDPLPMRAQRALVEVGVPIAEGGVVEENGALQVTLEASEATQYDDQLLHQWALCLGTLGALAQGDVRILNTVGGHPAVRVTATRENIDGLAKGTLQTADFLALMKVEKLLPLPAATPLPPPATVQKPTPPPRPQPRPVQQRPRTMRAPSTMRPR